MLYQTIVQLFLSAVRYSHVIMVGEGSIITGDSSAPGPAPTADAAPGAGRMELVVDDSIKKATKKNNKKKKVEERSSEYLKKLNLRLAVCGGRDIVGDE